MSIETRIEYSKSLKVLSTFGIGGDARQFITIHTIEEMGEIRKYVSKEKIPFWVIGKGSNSLFDDRGFDGLVILNKIDFIEFDKGKLHVGAGTSFSLLGAKMARKGWGGLEFASGIPGSVGGAIYMNAGANGMETCDHLSAVGFIDEAGNFIEKKKMDLAFSYRTSSFHEGDKMIVSGRFELEKREEAREKQLKIIEYRTATQPYGEKSAGCIFRNPQGGSAGALIEACGLKGKKIGGAEVSTLHANFIVNRGDATAQDVLELATVIRETIREKTGTELEMEVHKIPFRLGEHVPS
ncbi:MAG: UDP-N-acetylmuramate dehydrogenase [Simkaniaceae bacterium]|nr:MAG: UDP-N-acetylmuramate dehydrogenase [Simkaniaceae bacterium]